MTLPAVGAVLLCGAEHGGTVCVGVLVNDPVGVDVADCDAVRDALGEIVCVLLVVDAGEPPIDWEAEGDDDIVGDAELAGVALLDMVEVAESDPMGTGAIASERYSVFVIA